jgi:hypothetical protein
MHVDEEDILVFVRDDYGIADVMKFHENEIC